MLMEWDRRRLGGAAVILWIAATSVGVVICYGLFIPLGLVTGGGSGVMGAIVALMVGAICGALGGAVVGGLQQLTLPAWASWAKDWMRGTILGWALGGALFSFLTYVVNSYFSGLDPNSGSLFGIMVAGAALGIGLGQGVVMRPWQRSVIWAGATMGSWVLGVSITIILSRILGMGSMLMTLAIFLPGVSIICTTLILVMNRFLGQVEAQPTE